MEVSAVGAAYTRVEANGFAVSGEATSRVPVKVNFLKGGDLGIMFGHDLMSGRDPGDAPPGQVAAQKGDEHGTGSASRACLASETLNTAFSFAGGKPGTEFFRVPLSTFSRVLSCSRLHPAVSGGGHFSPTCGAQPRGEVGHRRPYR